MANTVFGLKQNRKGEFYIINRCTKRIPKEVYEFLRHKRRWSKNTQKAYGEGLKEYFSFLEEEGLGLKDVLCMQRQAQVNHFTDFLDHMRARGNSARTCNFRLKPVFAFYEYLYLEELTEKELKATKKQMVCFSDSMGISRARVVTTFDGYLNENKDIKKKTFLDNDLIKMVEEATCNIRDKVLLGVLKETGIRIGEALNMRVQDIDFDNNLIEVVARHSDNLDTCDKYQENRGIPISKELMGKLSLYMTKYKDVLSVQPYLFVVLKKGKSYGKQLRARDVYSMMRRIRNKLNLQTLHPHQYRYFFAAQLYDDSDADDLLVSLLLGHRKLETTKNYLEGHVRRKHIEARSRKKISIGDIEIDDYL